MTINLKMPESMSELKPRITVFGVGGAGGNAVNNMIQAGMDGVEFVVANTDAQALAMSSADRRIQMGTAMTEGLGAGSQPQIGAAAAEETLPEILDHVTGSHMVFITAGMGGGTGTGAAPVIARLAREQDILTVGVVTKPFQFEGARRMQIAERGIEELERHVDTLIVIPNQNLFRIANERTTFADAFAMADQVLYSGVAGITDLMVKEGLINLDFADVRTIMNGMGKAMMGTGEASGEKRAIEAAEAAISNPLLDDVSMKGARGLLISITGGEDLTLYEVDEAATRIRGEVDPEANIILGATFDSSLEGYIRVSVVATGVDGALIEQKKLQATSITGMGGGQEITPSPLPETAAPSSMMAPATDAASRAAHYMQARPAPAEQSFEDEAGDGYAEHDIAAGHPESDAYYHAEPQTYEPAREFGNDVTVRRIDAGRNFGHHAAPGVASHHEVAPAPASAHDPRQPFVPPAPMEAPRSGPRMPRVDELPVVAQREIESHGAEPQDHGIEAQKRKTGFLERLASVGLGRRETEGSEAQEPRFGDAQPAAQKRPEDMIVPPADAGAARPVDHPLRRAEGSATAGRPAAMQMAAPQTPTHADDDALEIPAFLRRQAN